MMAPQSKQEDDDVAFRNPDVWRSTQAEEEGSQEEEKKQEVKFAATILLLIALISGALAQDFPPDGGQWFDANPFLGIVTSVPQSRVPFQGARKATGWIVRNGTLEYGNRFVRTAMPVFSSGESRAIAYHPTTNEVIVSGNGLWAYNLETGSFSNIRDTLPADNGQVTAGDSLIQSTVPMAGHDSAWIKLIPVDLPSISIGDSILPLRRVLSSKWAALSRAVGNAATITDRVGFVPGITPGVEVTAIGWSDTTLMIDGVSAPMYAGGILAANSAPSYPYKFTIDSVTQASGFLRLWSSQLAGLGGAATDVKTVFINDTTRYGRVRFGGSGNQATTGTQTYLPVAFDSATYDLPVLEGTVSGGNLNSYPAYIRTSAQPSIGDTNWEFIGSATVGDATTGGSNGTVDWRYFFLSDARSAFPITGDLMRKMDAGFYGVRNYAGSNIVGWVRIADTAKTTDLGGAYTGKYKLVAWDMVSGYTVFAGGATDNAGWVGPIYLYRLKPPAISSMAIKPSISALHSGRAWYAGVSGEEDVLYHSALRNYDSIIGYEVLESGQPIKSLMEIGDQLAIFRTGSVFTHTGFSEIDFYYSRTPSPAGVLSFNSVARDDRVGGAYYLSPSGYYRYADGSGQRIPIEFVDLPRDSIAWAYPQYVHGTVFRGQHVVSYAPTGSTVPDRLVSIDVESESPALAFIDGPDVSSFVVANPKNGKTRLFAGDADSTLLWEYIPDSGSVTLAAQWSTGWLTSPSADDWLRFDQFASTIDADSNKAFIFRFAVNYDTTTVFTDTVTTTSPGDTAFVNQLGVNVVGYALSCTVQASHHSVRVAALSVHGAPIGKGGAGG